MEMHVITWYTEMEEWEKSTVAKEEAAQTNNSLSSKLHLQKKVL